MPRVKQRTADLRERGLASALAVLAEEGVAGLTTRAVAARAGASVPAIYEVFGDKAGLIREVFCAGFRLLAADLAALPPAADPRAALLELAAAFRRFARAHPELAQVMFSRPFTDFDPTAEQTRAGVQVRRIFLRHIRAAIADGQLAGDPTDLALVFSAAVTGLAAAEGARRLGGSRQSVDRRWRLGLTALLDGLRPTDSREPR